MKPRFVCQLFVQIKLLRTRLVTHRLTTNTVTLAWLVPLILACSACVNLAPDHQRPTLPVPSDYKQAFQPDGTQTIEHIGWRQFFQDPRLERLIETALLNNRDLQIATARIAEARARYRISDSARLPNIGLDAAGVRSRMPLEGGAGTQTSIAANRYDLSVGISAFELDFWSRVSNLSAAAKAEYLSTVAAQRAFQLSLISDVAGIYFTILETNARIGIALETLDSRKQELQIAKRRLDSGVTSALDYRQAEALLTQTETELAAQRLALAQSRNALLVFTGGPIMAPLPQGRSLQEQGLHQKIDAGLPSDLLLLRPDIIVAEYNLQSARANIGVARAAFFPRITLTGTAGYSSASLQDLVGEDSLSWRWGPSLNLPLFDWGNRRASLDVAKAREVASVATYERAIQTAFREVSDALAGRRWLADQTAAQERNLIALEAIARLARVRYREGTAEYLEVLDAERSLFSARQSLVLLQRRQAENFVSLYIALGGDIELGANR